ncbi:MAG: transcriptional repressor LexA [Clostridia bacterium]|nr:transcriptional repressor LexA [Clostridia bacterium]
MEEKILEFIESFSKENGYPPSVREIGSAVGFRSPATVHSYIKKLEEEGKLLQDSSKTRSITIPGITAEDRHDISTDHIVVPVLGNVAAGVPITATENIMDMYAMPSYFANKGEVFMLKVRGDSMINAGILDGDFVIVSKQAVARTHEIVVAMIDGEATVKRYYNEGNRIRLQPENDAMEPIYSDRVEIVGKVIGVFRTTVI